jgi:DNA-binding MarR family transcriptional regulator
MPEELDDIIHQKTRLRIMSYLAAAGEVDFLTLTRDLELTNGNLSIHSVLLEKAGYLEVEKSFVGRKSRTVYRITAVGQQAFRRYVEEIESVLRRGMEGQV